VQTRKEVEMTRFYLDQAWFDSDYNTDSEEDWELANSDTPDWFEDNMVNIEQLESNYEEWELIKRVAILVIVSLIKIDVIVIVIEILQSGIIVHYNKRSW
jgi:hypothetical protein